MEYNGSMQQILTETQTNGDLFHVEGGMYQIVVIDFQANVGLELESPDGSAWVDTQQRWTAAGVKAMYLSAEVGYRVAAGTAGAKAWVMHLDKIHNPYRT